MKRRLNFKARVFQGVLTSKKYDHTYSHIERVPKINPTPKVLHNAGAGPGQLCVT